MAVSDVIAAQQAYATDAISDANGFLNALSDLASASYFSAQSNASIPSPGFAWDTTEETTALLTGFFPVALEVDDISAMAPMFVPDTVDSLPDIVVPDFTSVAPVLDLPQAPSAALPSVPTAPSISDPVLPSAPIITLPTAPVVTGISFPEVPGLEIPTFVSSLPIDDLVAPTNSFEFFEQLYTSALLDALQAKLLDALQNGGYGIEPIDEAALWDRARSRELEAALSEAEDLVAQAASRGFPLPPGDLTVVLQRAHQKAQGKISGVNRDIALKRADLYVANRQFTIEQTKQLEQVLIGYHNSVMERSLNSAKAVLDASIQIFNAQVSRFNARLDSYKSEAAVFETRVRAALAGVEIYRVQMEGKRIEVDVQRAQVEVYNAQLNGVNSVVNLYKVQMEAAQVQAGVERLRIEAFRSLVDAYTAQVQAKVAEFNMFESQIKGEVAKMQAYEVEARAYTATVDGAKAKADVAIARLRGQLEVAKNTVDVFRTEMEGYKTDILAQAQTIDARVRVYGGQVQGASAKSSAVGEALRLDVSKKDLEFRRNVENAKIAVEDARTFLTGAIESAKVRLGSSDAASRYYTALVGAAVNSINTLTALTATE
mgnify:CR=1 FL=1